MKEEKPKFLQRDEKSAKWWLGCKSSRSKWIVKAGDDWWIIPRRQVSDEEIPLTSGKNKKIKKNSNKMYIFLHILAILLGISLAVNLLQALI